MHPQNHRLKSVEASDNVHVKVLAFHKDSHFWGGGKHGPIILFKVLTWHCKTSIHVKQKMEWK